MMQADEQITVMSLATAKDSQWRILHLADKMIVGDAVEW